MEMNLTSNRKVKYNSDNIVVKLNDLSLSEEDTQSSFNYLPFTQELVKNFKNSEEELPSIEINSKLKINNISNRPLKNETRVFFPNDLESFVSAVQQRISIVYFKNSKLFINKNSKFLNYER